MSGMNELTSIPIEVVRKGLTEEYVNLFEARRESIENLDRAISDYYETELSIRKLLKTARKIEMIDALLVEETAKRLPEIVGRIKEAQKELEEITDKINQMEVTVYGER